MHAWSVAILCCVGLTACSLGAPGDTFLSGGEPLCAVGQKRCDGQCVDVTQPALGCATASCEACNLPNATAECTRGQCAVLACKPGFADCDGTPGNGCEEEVSGAESPCSCHAVRLTTPQSYAEFVPSGADVGSGDWTLELWVKRPPGMLHLVNTHLGESNAIMLRVDSDPPRLVCTLYETDGVSTNNVAKSKQLVATGVWQHLACVRRGAELRAYVSGKPGDIALADGTVGPGDPDAAAASRGRIGYDTQHPLPVPVLVGPARFSVTARYDGEFAPAPRWRVDGLTVAQYLVASPHDPIDRLLVDEAGGDNNAACTGIDADADNPCAPSP